jgi:hypothetical protein
METGSWPAIPYLTGALALVVLLVFVGLMIYWTNRRSTEMIQRWAEGNGYMILDMERRLFRRGPFFLTTSRSQTVYYVTLVDPQGGERRGWVRCGSFWLGIFANTVEVRWDEPDQL